MSKPSYQRAFSAEDFMGYFRWSKIMSKFLVHESVYHACHEDELINNLQKGKLILRSNWSINLPEHGECSVPGVWVGLNYYHNENKYGPFLIEFPIDVLNGRRFMAFRRKDTDRKRLFFVQYESQIPIFSFKGDVWKKVRLKPFFEDMGDGTYGRKPGDIYDIVLTKPLSISLSKSIRAVRHRNCISEKCSDMKKLDTSKKVREIAGEHFYQSLVKKGVIDEFLDQFPDLEDREIKIKFKR